MFAVLVPMPVTAVDEDDDLVLGDDDIGTSGELFIFGSVDGEAEAATVEQRAEQEFGLGRVKDCAPRDLPRDPGHDPTPFLFVEEVRHGETRVPRIGVFGKLGLRDGLTQRRGAAEVFLGLGT